MRLDPSLLFTLHVLRITRCHHSRCYLCQYCSLLPTYSATAKADVPPEFSTSSLPAASLNCSQFFTLSFWAHVLQEQCLQPQVRVMGLDVSQQVKVNPMPSASHFQHEGNSVLNEFTELTNTGVTWDFLLGHLSQSELILKKSLDYLMLITSWMVHCSLKYL